MIPMNKSCKVAGRAAARLMFAPDYQAMPVATKAEVRAKAQRAADEARVRASLGGGELDSDLVCDAVFFAALARRMGR